MHSPKLYTIWRYFVLLWFLSAWFSLWWTMDVSTRIVGQNCNHYVFSKIVAIFVSFKHYCCKKEPCKRRKNEKKTTLATAIIVKPKKGQKGPFFVWGIGGLEPTPSRDGDGHGWWHWPLRHVIDFVQGWRNKLYDLCYYVNPTKIEKSS